MRKKRLSEFKSRPKKLKKPALRQKLRLSETDNKPKKRSARRRKQKRKREKQFELS